MQLSDITTIKLNVFKRNSGKLAALQHGEEIPWNIQRIFFITTREAEERGDHAHIHGYQAFVCVTGSAHLVCKDGIDQGEFVMNPLDEVVLVPPGIWVNISLFENSALAVMADLPYDEDDYINEWDDFIKLKGIS